MKKLDNFEFKGYYFLQEVKTGEIQITNSKFIVVYGTHYNKCLERVLGFSLINMPKTAIDNKSKSIINISFAIKGDIDGRLVIKTDFEEWWNLKDFREYYTLLPNEEPENLEEPVLDFPIPSKLGKYSFWENNTTGEVVIADENLKIIVGSTIGRLIDNTSYKASNIPNTVIVDGSVRKNVEFRLDKNYKLIIEILREDSCKSIWTDLNLFSERYILVNGGEKNKGSKETNTEISNTVNDDDKLGKLGDYQFYRSVRGEVYIAKNKRIQFGDNKLQYVGIHDKPCAIPTKCKFRNSITLHNIKIFIEDGILKVEFLKDGHIVDLGDYFFKHCSFVLATPKAEESLFSEQIKEFVEKNFKINSEHLETITKMLDFSKIEKPLLPKQAIKSNGIEEQNLEIISEQIKTSNAVFGIDPFKQEQDSKFNAVKENYISPITRMSELQALKSAIDFNPIFIEGSILELEENLNRFKENKSLKLLSIEDEEDLMNVEVFKMDLIK